MSYCHAVFFALLLFSVCMLTGCDSLGRGELGTSVHTRERVTTVIDDLSLDEIAEINRLSVEDLTAFFDDSGHLTFLGNKYSGIKVKDAKSAEDSLQNVLSMCDLRGSTLKHVAETRGKITGFTYHIFAAADNKSDDSASDDEKKQESESLIAAEASGTIISISDSDGNTRGLINNIADSVDTYCHSRLDRSYGEYEELFSRLTDVGTYEFALDMSWRDKYIDLIYREDTPGQIESMNVSIPVMYDRQTRLYYLGSYADSLLAVNGYDYESTGHLNCVVSENPRDLKNWRWLTNDSKRHPFELGYVLGAYSTFAGTFTSVTEGKSILGSHTTVSDSACKGILLKLYSTEMGGYQKDVYDYYDNMRLKGINNGIAVFETSPVGLQCLSSASVKRRVEACLMMLQL